MYETRKGIVFHAVIYRYLQTGNEKRDVINKRKNDYFKDKREEKRNSIITVNIQKRKRKHLPRQKK
jgi:hypothetical protein